LLNIIMNTPETQITLQDLAVIKNLIDVACQRGAFRAEEMRTVGELYEKLSGFLETVVAQAEAAQLQQGETE
jgi:hypothetical protein